MLTPTEKVDINGLEFRPSSPWASYGQVLGLRELMEYLADEWMWIVRDLERLCDPLNIDLLSKLNDPASREKALDPLKSLVQHCDEVGLEFTAMYGREMLGKCEHLSLASGFSFVEFQNEARILRKRFDDECQSHLIVFVESNRVKLYISLQLFAGALDAFPSIRFDVIETGKCYAFGRDTACVFHLMCILQVGLNALAKRLNVSFEYKNWENVINEIEVRIKSIERGELKSSEWREDQTFYAEAALQFRHFKDAWRNHAAHGREHYNAERAESIFNHVKEFIQHLSKKLSE